jgi:hypothetical protein
MSSARYREDKAMWEEAAEEPYLVSAQVNNNTNGFPFERSLTCPQLKKNCASISQ